MRKEILKDCQECKQTFSAYRPQSKYCSDCGIIVQARYRYGLKKRKQNSQVFENKMIDQGIKTSLQNRFNGEFSAPELAWSITIETDFSTALSKNSIWRNNGNTHRENREETFDVKSVIVEKAKKALMEKGIAPINNTVWLSIFIEKPNFKSDAVNLVDHICDAIKEGIGVDDRWFSINYLHWSVVKEDPKIYIKIGQEEFCPKRICSHCGLKKDLKHYGSRKGRVSTACLMCCRIYDAERKSKKKNVKIGSGI